MNTNVSWEKFHPILYRTLGNELRVAVSADVDLSRTGLIHCPDNPGAVHVLLHRNNQIARYYFPAVIETVAVDSEEIRFRQCWRGEFVVKKYGITFWAQAAGAGDFWMQFGRFGEDKPFSFGHHKHPYHIPLTLKDQNVREFNPLFVKVFDREKLEIVSFVIKASSDNEKVISISLVGEDEMPPCLKGLNRAD